MKQSLSELQTQVEAKSKVFGKFSPYPISCDDLLWLIKQVNAAQQPRALDKCQHCNGAGVLMTAIGSKLCPRCEGSGTCQ